MTDTTPLGNFEPNDKYILYTEYIEEKGQFGLIEIEIKLDDDTQPPIGQGEEVQQEWYRAHFTA